MFFCSRCRKACTFAKVAKVGGEMVPLDVVQEELERGRLHDNVSGRW